MNIRKVRVFYRFRKILPLLFLLLYLTGCGNPAAKLESSGNIPAQTEGAADGAQENQAAEKLNREVPADTAGDSGRIAATVIKVVDGDTFDARFADGSVERVRLILIDTPETKHPRIGEQPFGKEASDFTAKLLTGKKVELELDVQERDQYGRILAYAYVGGKMVNKLLLEKGLARVAVFPPNTKYVDEFREIQDEARKKGIGIWSIENYVKEDGFQSGGDKRQTGEDGRRPTGEKSCQHPTIKGNINSRGEKIYHLPGGRYYDVTKAEEWFCTEEEAMKAGFRKSRQ